MLNDATGIWETPERQTTRSKKVLRNHVKAPATDKHPAQVDVYQEDTIVGTWNTRNMSGAMRLSDIRVLQERLERLRDAVKYAREQANSVEVQPFNASAVLDYLIQL